MDFVAIDFETTGYDNGCNNEPWQLGIAVVQGGEIVEEREFFFGTPITPEHETVIAQWDLWFTYVANKHLLAHNIATERTILTKIAPLTKWGPWTDTLKVAKSKYPGLKSYALKDLCELFGSVPDIEGRTWHDGLYDAVACARLGMVLKVI